MSPGTSVEIGISCGRSMPLRSTAVVELTIAFNSCAALLERNSCQKRSSVLSNIMEIRTIMVRNVRSSGAAKITSENRETKLTANNTPLNGVRKAWKSCRYHVGGFSCVTSLGPYCSRRASTCSGVSPLRAVSSFLSASSGEQSHRSSSGDGRLLLFTIRLFGKVLSCSFMAHLRRPVLSGLKVSERQTLRSEPCSPGGHRQDRSGYLV